MDMFYDFFKKVFESSQKMAEYNQKCNKSVKKSNTYIILLEYTPEIKLKIIRFL